MSRMKLPSMGGIHRLGRLEPRQRAVLKLRTGCAPLNAEELAFVIPERREEAAVVRPRTLQEVGNLLGLTRERIRQIQDSALRTLEQEEEEVVVRRRGRRKVSR
jgi:DNA-directed RNA polymerase sigma subunit (sigma70/sigma32)